jgi:hypothetical protein
MKEWVGHNNEFDLYQTAVTLPGLNNGCAKYINWLVSRFLEPPETIYGDAYAKCVHFALKNIKPYIDLKRLLRENKDLFQKHYCFDCKSCKMPEYYCLDHKKLISVVSSCNKFK